MPISDSSAVRNRASCLVRANRTGEATTAAWNGKGMAADHGRFEPA